MADLSPERVRFKPPRPWTEADDRLAAENGWTRWRPDWGDDEIFLDVSAANERDARVKVMGAFRLAPHDVVWPPFPEGAEDSVDADPA
jgi:hypothetical protein